LKLMHEGRSDAQIKQFLVERYGEFVLYRPQMEGSTLLLWLGPGLLLLAGAVVLVLHVRRRARSVPASAADDASQEEREW
ncbi:MAG: cytochrome c-type biogenesis protein CcmH, partial [Stenotrophomonas sp.]